MIIVMEREATEAAVAAVEAKIRAKGLDVHVSRGTERTLIGAVGDERKLDPEMFESMEGVEKSMHILKPYKLVAREWHKANTVVDAGGVPIGGKTVQVIAGPCSVETHPQMHAAAEGARAGGAQLMRGGAFKPRTSPYAFQGKGIEGLKLLKDAAASCKLPVVTELMDARMLDEFLKHGVDVIQIGTRNMQNFDLLKAVGQVTTPVILKRGMSATISEWLMAGEYIAAGGKPQHHLLRAGHSHVRDGLPQRARRDRDRGDEARDAPSGDRRSVARRRQGVDGARIVVRGGRRGGRRSPDRDPPDAEGGAVRRRPGADAGRVRDTHAAAPGDRPRSGPRPLSLRIIDGVDCCAALGVPESSAPAKASEVAP
jgi:hypothetical protein